MLRIFTLFLCLLFPLTAGAQSLEKARHIRLTKGPIQALKFTKPLVQSDPLNGAYQFEHAVALAEAGMCLDSDKAFKRADALLNIPLVALAREDSLERNCAVATGWSRYLSFSTVADTNYNNAPGSDTIEIQGLPFTLSKDAQAQERYGFNVGFGFTHSKRLSWDKSLRSGVDVNALFLTKGDSELSLSPRLDLRQRINRGYAQFGLATKAVLGEDGLKETAIGLRFGLEKSFTNYQKIGLGVEHWFTENAFSGKKGQDTTAVAVWSTPLNAHTLSAGVQISHESREEDYDTLTTGVVTLGLQGLIGTYGYDVGIGGGLARGASVDPLFGVRREDTIVKAHARIQIHDIETPFGSPIIGVSHTTQNSNIGLFEFEKTQIEFGFAKSF